MTPQELTASILQLAIQGKLVEQRAEEGTAAELLRDILTQRRRDTECAEVGRDHRARRNGRLAAPQPPIPDDEKPFDIPESWEWVRLGEVVSLLSGRDLEPSEYSATPKKYPYMTGASNFANGILLVNRWTDRPVTISHIGDLLITCKGTVGAMAFNAIGDIHIARQIMAISSASIDLHYVKVFLAASVQSLKAAANSMIPGIDRKTMLFRPIPLPPLAEQKRIVAKIEELLPLIDRYEKAWSKLEDFNKRFPVDMQKSLLQMAIQGKLVEQRPEEGTGEELYRQIQAEKQCLVKSGDLKKTKSLPVICEGIFEYDFPETWKLCYIDDIAFVTKLAGFEYTEYIAPNLVSQGVPLFKGKNVQNGRVVLDFESYIPIEISDSLPRSQIRKKCLLTPYVGTIGNIAIFDGSFRAHLGSNVGKIELLNGKKQYVLEEYVLYYLRSVVGYSELTKYKKATAQESISIDAIRNVIIPLPPFAEQKRIVAKLEELLPLCERLK